MQPRYLPYILTSLLSVFSLLILTGCTSKTERPVAKDGNIFEEASYITATPGGDGVMDVTILNPWDSASILASYHLINNEVGKVEATDGGITLTLPLRRLIVYSSVHAALLTELGYADAIVGVADAAYIRQPELTQRLADGRIADIGSSMEPSLEKIIALYPDAILVSPFQNAGHGVLDKAGVPVIECADYMENSPLGRAEWSKFFAMLVEGISQTNSKTYDTSRDKYLALVEKARGYDEKPKVITEMPSNGNWLMPGGHSYAGRLLIDAGATYPFENNTSPGSVPMSYEKAFSAAQDADFWLVKSFGEEMTLKDVARNHPLNTRIWAYNNGGIYYSDTSTSNLFEETPFHPELLLADYITIFHHTGDSLSYYRPVR